MDDEKRKALTQNHTIFLENGQPKFENLSTLPELWWVSVRLTMTDRLVADPELMDVVIQHLKTGKVEFNHYEALHHQKPLCVSLPVMNLEVGRQGWVYLAIRLAEH